MQTLFFFVRKAYGRAQDEGLRVRPQQDSHWRPPTQSALAAAVAAQQGSL